MKKILTTTILCLGLFMIGCQKEAVDSDEQALTPEETELNEIKAFAEEHGLTYRILDIPSGDGICITFEELKQMYQSNNITRANDDPDYVDINAKCILVQDNWLDLYCKIDIGYGTIDLKASILIDLNNLDNDSKTRGPLYESYKDQNWPGMHYDTYFRKIGNNYALESMFFIMLRIESGGKEVGIAKYYTATANDIVIGDSLSVAPPFTIKYYFFA